MKYAIIIPDGCADEPQVELGGKTPLAAAAIPVMDALAKRGLELVEGVDGKPGQVKFVPPNWINTYRHWMENIQDWCISRQLWWGHRIPAWYDAAGTAYVGRSEEEVRAKHGLGGVAGYDLAETDDADPARVAVVQDVTAAYLRSVLDADGRAWADARRSLTIGRIDSK